MPQWTAPFGSSCHTFPANCSTFGRAYFAGGAGRGLLTAALQLALLDLGPDTQQGAAGATGAAGSMAEVYPAASWLRSSCQANGEQATGSGASLQQQEGGREQGAAPGAQKQDEDEDGGPATVTGTRAAGTQEGQGSGGGGAGGRAGGGAPAADVGALMHARRVMADLLLRPPGDDTRGAACRWVGRDVFRVSPGGLSSTPP